MNFLSKLKISIVGFGLLLCSSSVFGGNAMTVYFIPFEVETYVPITQATIISHAWEKWTISSKSDSSHLIALLNHGNTHDFDQNKVRCLVLSDQRTFVIDSNGVVLEKGESGIKIDKAAFMKFRGSLPSDQRQILKQGSP